MATRVHLVHETRCPELGPICDERAEPPQLHDQRFLLAELRLVSEYALADWLSLEAQLPLKVSATSITYRRLDGEEFTPDYEDIHHRNETVVGPMDPWLSARSHATGNGVSVGVRGGVTLPFGRTEPDPFALGERGEVHQHLQLGTGTVMPLVGLDAAMRLGQVVLSAHGLAQLSLYDNAHGYRAGNRYSAGVLVDSPALLGGLVVSLGADVIREQAERWNGRVHEEGNLGRTDVLAGVTLLAPLGDYAVALGLDVPVVQDLAHAAHSHDGHEASQLEYPALLEVSVTRVLAFD